MIIKVPIIETFALQSKDGIEFTWAEIGSNPMCPTGRKDMPMVNVYNVSKLNNQKNMCIGTERTKDIDDLYSKIVQIYKDTFDHDMKSNYSEYEIKERFKFWIRHVYDAWTQKGNIINGSVVWNHEKWSEFANNIFPKFV